MMQKKPKGALDTFSGAEVKKQGYENAMAKSCFHFRATQKVTRQNLTKK